MSFPRRRESIPLSLRTFEESAAIPIQQLTTENFSSKKAGFSNSVVEYRKGNHNNVGQASRLSIMLLQGAKQRDNLNGRGLIHQTRSVIPAQAGIYNT